MIHRFLILAGCLILASAGTRSLGAARPSEPSSSKAAEALLGLADAKMQRIQTLSADFTTIRRYPPLKPGGHLREFRDGGHVELRKPNLMRVDSWILDRKKGSQVWTEAVHFIDQSDGVKYHFVNVSDGEYLERSAGKDVCSVNEGLFDFDDPSQSVVHRVRDARKKGCLYKLELVGSQTWEGSRYTVVHLVMYESGAYHSRSDELIYIAADDIIHRIINHFHIDNAIGTEEDQLRNVVVGAPISLASFQYTVPTGMKPLDAPSPPVLATGAVAPDFTIADTDAKPISLTDFKGQVVVIDFWATWCGPCQRALPGTNKLAEEYRSKGVVFLGVNVWDDIAAFKSWLPEHKDYDAIRFAIDTHGQGKDVATSLYKVSGIPTQFVIGRDGKVVQSMVGFGDESGIKAAIDQALAAPGPSAQYAPAGGITPPTALPTQPSSP